MNGCGRYCYCSRTRATKLADLSGVIVDNTVQPKNVTFPADAKLVNRAHDKANSRSLACYARAHPFGRANKALRKLKILAASSATSPQIAGDDAQTKFYTKFYGCSTAQPHRQVHEQERAPCGRLQTRNVATTLKPARAGSSPYPGAAGQFR
jgi:hypothetical protein